MKIIQEKLHKSFKINHVIYNLEDINPKTFSSKLLLIDYYKNHDISYVRDHDWRYYFIVRRYFLRKVSKKDENNKRYWNCHYCNKKIDKIQDKNIKKRQKNTITVDHVVPVSNPDSDKLNIKNMVECCQKCNEDKGSNDYYEFLNKIK